MNQPKKNLAESVLARAELFRRGMLFDGVPKFAPDIEMPASPAADNVAGVTPVAPADQQAAPVAVPGAADALTAGAVAGNSPLETILQP